jgi:hypothetical protein
MWLYHWIRAWSSPEHQTMWVEIQAIATILAFVAAAVYAAIARRQTHAIIRQTELSEKDYVERNKPIVFTDRVEGHYVVRNVGGGYAVNAYYFAVEVISPVSMGRWQPAKREKSRLSTFCKPEERSGT